MGTTNLTRLNVALTLLTGGFSGGATKAGKIADDLGNRLKSAIMGPVGLITGAISTGAFVAGVKSAADRIDGLAKASDRLGVSTESLAGLRLAAEESGSSAEQLEQAMSKLQIKVAEAAAGNKEAAASFQALGVPLRDLVNLPADQQFGKIADAINGLQGSGKQAAATVDIFGKGMAGLSATLANGSTGLQKATEDAKAMGLAISRVDAAKVEEANDAFGRIGMVLQGVFNKIAVELSPFITAISQSFTDASISAKGWGDSIKWAVDGAVSVVGFFLDAWQGITLAFQAARTGAAYLAYGLTSAMEAGIEGAQWLGAKFSQAFDLMRATAEILWEALRVGWAGMKIPISDFVQFAAGQFASLLEVASKAAYQFSATQGAAMLEAAASVRTATGAMGADARRELDTHVAGLTDASKKVADATTALFSSVQVSGSAMLQMLKDDFSGLIDSEKAKLDDMRNQPLASDTLAQNVETIRAEADLRAQARAADISATQAHTDAKIAIETSGWLKYYQWERQERESNLDHNNRILMQGLGQSSSFFGNLSALQQSHSKKAQEIGKAAAKAKIVVDTASAAMGAYSALAGIPIVGPALGAAAAAAAIVAGGVQLSNVDSGGMGTSNTGTPSASSSISSTASAPTNNQTLILQGDVFSGAMLEKMYKDAKEQGIVIDGVRRG